MHPKEIYSALVTPYGEDGMVNERALIKLLEFQSELGLSGVYVGGSSGEGPMQNSSERETILQLVAKHGAGLKKIAHIGTIATEESLRLSKVSNDCGYDAISAISPFYYGFSESEVMQHYFTLAQNTSVPLIVYNFPARNLGLSFEACCKLLEHKNIEGVKFTSSDLYTLDRIKRAFPEKIIYNGFDEMTLAGLSMGADGCIGTTFNFMGDLIVAIAELFQLGKMPEALELQGMANELIEAVYPSIINGTKYVVSQMGVPCGEARKPFQQLNWADDAELQNRISRLLHWRQARSAA